MIQEMEKGFTQNHLVWYCDHALSMARIEKALNPLVLSAIGGLLMRRVSFIGIC